MLEHVQLIKADEQAMFAVIPYQEYLFLKEILFDEEKLADYLDYLHTQRVKKQSSKRLSLAEVKELLNLA
ncbi:MAG: hypothetical protein IAE79_27090 [Anaerolinea sp.]|nr:hypothetical protein [Anaerolinea sp.]